MTSVHGVLRDQDALTSNPPFVSRVPRPLRARRRHGPPRGLPAGRGYIVFSATPCDYAMSRQSTSYASIPDDKKFYVLSNLI